MLSRSTDRSWQLKSLALTIGALGLIASCSANAGTVDTSSGSTQQPAASENTTELVLTASELVVDVSVPTKATLGEMVTINYSVRNPTEIALDYSVGGCEGPVRAYPRSREGKRSSFRDASRTGACDDVIEIESIQPGGTVSGSAVWKAGSFSPGPSEAGLVEIELRFVAVDDGADVSGTGSTTIEVS